MRISILEGGIHIGVLHCSSRVAIAFMISIQIFSMIGDHPVGSETVTGLGSIPAPQSEPEVIGMGFFTENIGQWNGDVLFSTMTGFGTAIFSDNEVIYGILPSQSPVSVSFKGARSTKPIGIGDMGFSTNFFLGNDTERWVSGARSFQKILYKDAWSNIDIEYYYTGPDIKYDIIVHPGGDPGDIDLEVSGHSGFEIEKKSLSILLSGGASIRDGELKAMSDKREDVPIIFTRTGKDSYGFNVEKDPCETLIIDPLIYSTIINGAGYPIDLTKDDENCTYFLTLIYGPTPLITPGVYNTTFWGVDYYLLKMNSTGTGVVFATVIGGYTVDMPVAVVVDRHHDIYIGGNSASPDFPTTPGVIQETHQMSDDFTITKLNSTGDRLIYSTFIGGSSGDLLGDIGVYDGCVYLTGYANSKDIPSKMGPIGGVHGILYFSMIDRNATDFLDSTFWDGYYTEYSTCMEIDHNGEAVIGGHTSSSDFPVTMHSYQNLATNSLLQGFILRYDPFGAGTIFSSIVGPCSVQDLALDGNSDIVYTGTVRWDPHGSKPWFPLTEGTFGEDFSGYNDIFISKLRGNGTKLLWNTLVGGSQNETDPTICLDRAGNIYIMGQTQSKDHPTTPLCYDSSLDGEDDAFFFKLSPNGSALKYSSYLGMNGTEVPRKIILEGMNIISLLGTTSSGNFPVTSGAFTLKNTSEGGIFLSIFSISSTPGQTLNLTAVEGDGNITLFWDPPIDDGNEPITNYQIYRGPDPYNLTRYILTGPKEEFLDADVGFGIEYYYRVAAVNSVGEGDISSPARNISSTIPDPPTNLKAEVGIKHIQVTFEPPSFTGGVDIMGYEVYRNGESIAELEPSDNSFLDEHIVQGSDYTYNAISLNRNGGSLMSKGVSVRSKSPPSPPKNFTAIALNDRVVLRWEEPEDFGGLDISNYVLYKGISLNLLDPVLYLCPETVIFDDHSVFKGEEYFYAVSAFNEMGGSEKTPVVTAIPMSIPSKPCNPLACPGMGYINISWSAPRDPGGDENISFRLYHGTEELEIRLLVVLNGDTMQFQHSGIKAGIKHFYYVTAVNDIGESEGSYMVSASIFRVPPPPSEIELEPGPDSIKIIWERPPDSGPLIEHEYLILRRVKESGLEEITRVGPETGSYTDASVNRRTLYFYSIRTQSDLGNSEPSHEVHGTPLSYPDPPVKVKVDIGTLGLEVSWDPPAYNGSIDVTWYSIFRKDPSGANVLLRYVDGNTTGMTDNSVDPGIYYSYTIKAYNPVGPSGSSEPAGNIYPGEPKSPVISMVEQVAGRIMIKWTPNATDGGAYTKNYNVYRAVPGEQFERIAVVGGHVLIYIDQNVEQGMIYEYCLTAENEAGESVRSEKVLFRLEVKEDPKDHDGYSPDIIFDFLAVILILLVLMVMILIILRRRLGREDTCDWEEE